ncbi:hypothetical protein ARTHRO8AJ_380015 [Arthrobacter sp. 8AJ]|nr:hypothetical protein ARTHRO8AJ_380015 [Arthrobacter sp. 8AJ]
MLWVTVAAEAAAGKPGFWPHVRALPLRRSSTTASMENLGRT